MIYIVTPQKNIIKLILIINAVYKFGLNTSFNVKINFVKNSMLENIFIYMIY